jgi:hypothetical protein
MDIASKSLGPVVGIFVAALALQVAAPAAASATFSGSNTPPHAAAAQQYAQDFSHGSRAVDYGYKSKKCKKSDKKCKTKAKTDTKSDKKD